ncbi:MAG TPA: recombinase, partial [Caldimonas sp.]
MRKGTASAWDLTALLNAADPKATLAERHLWLIRLLEWLRHASIESDARATPTPVLRLKHMLGVLERNVEHRGKVAELLGRFLREIDSAALLADFGFAPRIGLAGEFGRRLRARLLPLTPATHDLAELFGLLFPKAEDAAWIDALDDATLARLVDCLAPALASDQDWRAPLLDAIMFLSSAVRAAGFSTPLRLRMSPELLVDMPFRQLVRAAEQLREHAEATGAASAAALLQQAQYLRALLDTCRRCAASVHEHL